MGLNQRYFWKGLMGVGIYPLLLLWHQHFFVFQIKQIWNFPGSGHFIFFEAGLVEVKDELGKTGVGQVCLHQSISELQRRFFNKNCCICCFSKKVSWTSTIFSPTWRKRHFLSGYHLLFQYWSDNLWFYSKLNCSFLSKYCLDNFPEFSLSFLCSIDYLPKHMVICRKNLKEFPNISWYL